MPKAPTPKEPSQKAFNLALCQRVRALRKARKHIDGSEWTMREMAELMGVGVEAWRSYEVRVPLPHYLIPRFARVCGQSIEYVLTGKEPAKVRLVDQASDD